MFNDEGASQMLSKCSVYLSFTTSDNFLFWPNCSWINKLSPVGEYLIVTWWWEYLLLWSQIAYYLVFEVTTVNIRLHAQAVAVPIILGGGGFYMKY